MQIKSTVMLLGRETVELETITNDHDSKEVIEKWVEWFKDVLLESFKDGADVEILIGSKPTVKHFLV